MRAFLDTSSLVKKYVNEQGSEQLEKQLQKVSEIVVAPLYWVELNSALERRLNEKTLTSQQVGQIRQEAGRDLNFFSRVIWNEPLEVKAVEMIKKYYLKTLDSVQLASGIITQPDIFLTSDKNLYQVATKEIEAKFI